MQTLWIPVDLQRQERVVCVLPEVQNHCEDREGENVPEKLTLQEYLNLAVNLPYLEPFQRCCDLDYPEPKYFEPLEGRNILEVDRTCITECVCGKMYLSRWD